MTDSPIYALEHLTRLGELMVTNLHEDGHYEQFIPDRSIDFVEPGPYRVKISLLIRGEGNKTWYRTIGEIVHEDGGLAYEAVSELLQQGAKQLYDNIHRSATETHGDE